MERKVLLFVLWFLLMGNLFSQEKEPITLTAEVTPQSIHKGGEGVVVITCEVASDYHISDATSGLFEVTPDPLPGIVFEEAEIPEGEKEAYGYVYRGRVGIKIPFAVGRGASEGKNTISVMVKVQPCAEEGGVCFPPEIRKVEAQFSVLTTQEEVQAKVGERGGITGRLSRALEQGSIVAFLLVFLGGVFTSLTPCVYPMIPITIAVIGAQAGGGKLRGFVLSLFYVLGISITFSTLGVIAAKTGGLFGSYARHPVAIVFVAAVFFVMGLSMLGIFVLQMPSSLASKLQGKRRRGFVGALVTGLLAGLIVSPCISPLLVVVLAWVAKTGSVVLGVGLLFSFALGLGVLFILLGMFSGVIKNLPKSGAWMGIIERGFGVLLVALAIFFIRSLLPSLVYQGVWAVFFVVFGTFLGAFTPLDKEADKKRKIGKTTGILAVLVGGSIIFLSLAQWLGFGVRPEVEVKQISTIEPEWFSSDGEGFRQARLMNRPVLMDFFAEWCAACHELDEKTWSEERVRSELDRYVRIKLDLTRNDEQTQAYQNKYKIIGMPTVILFDVSGKEMFRFEGFKPPEDVLKILERY